jgi:hypothetical protein
MRRDWTVDTVTSLWRRKPASENNLRELMQSLGLVKLGILDQVA